MLAARPPPPSLWKGVDLAADGVPVLVHHLRTLHVLTAPTEIAAPPGAPEPTAPPERGAADRWPAAVAAAAVIAAAALVLHDLGDKSLWYDEAFTVGLVDRPFGDALWRIAHWELNQSPYYLVMLGWEALGRSEAFLRLPSAAFAVATVPAVYAVGRRLADPWTGAIAAAVVATHSLVVQWGQQLRAYSLLALLVTLATLLLVRAVERPTTGRIIAYAAVGAAAAYAHIAALLVLGAHAVSLLALRPLPWRLVRTAAVTGAVLTAPLAWYLLTRNGDPLNWIGEPSRRELRGTLADVAGGGTRHLVVLGALGTLGAVLSVVDARRHAGGLASWRTLVPVGWLVLPVAAVVVSTYTVKPLLVARFLIVVVPALALLVAVAIRRLPAPVAALAAVAVAVVSLQGVRDWYAVDGFEDWRGAVAAVEAAVEPGDAVMTLPSRAVHAVRYYGPDLETVSPEPGATTADRLWIIDRRSRFGTERPPPPGFDPWLFGNYRLVGEQRFTRLTVLLFERA